MASILSLRPKLFRTRNPVRDAHTDMDRLMTVRRAIVTGISDATRERQGLQQRVDIYYAKAASLLDNASDYSMRSAEEERPIQEAEANAAAAIARIGQIDLQIAKLGDMLAGLDQTLSGRAE